MLVILGKNAIYIFSKDFSEFVEIFYIINAFL